MRRLAASLLLAFTLACCAAYSAEAGSNSINRMLAVELLEADEARQEARGTGQAVSGCRTDSCGACSAG